jgi:threonine/homoserine/homoserine lactone efflux protein
MFGTHDLWLFVLSGLLLNITPGPDTLYIVGRSSNSLAPNAAFKRWFNRCVGSVFIFIGIRLALTHER